MVKLNNATQHVDNALCEDAGLPVPETVERCGQVECPRWHTSAWTHCKESRCISRHKAVQRRTVTCRRPPPAPVLNFVRKRAIATDEEEEEDEEDDDSLTRDDGPDWSEQLPEVQCAEDERPVPRQECYNSRCMAVWNVEPWSEVSWAEELLF